MTETRHRPSRRARRSLSLLLTSALTAAGLLVTAAPAQAESTLRELAAQNGGRHFGTAIAYSPLNSDAQYRNIAATQFSAITHENEMKWESLEPQRGQYNWSQADNIINFAKANNRLCAATTWSGTASCRPGWATAACRQPGPVHHGEPHRDGGRTLQGRASTPGTWSTSPSTRTARSATRVWYHGHGSRLHRRRDPQGARGRPRRQAVHQRLQHRRQQRQEQRPCTTWWSLLARRACRSTESDSEPLHRRPGALQLQANMQRFADLGLDVAITELDDRMQLPATSTSLQQQAPTTRPWSTTAWG